jgi:hypothetical protein
MPKYIKKRKKSNLSNYKFDQKGYHPVDDSSTVKVTIEHEDCLYILRLDDFEMKETSQILRDHYEMEGHEQHHVSIEGVILESELYMRNKNEGDEEED